MFESIFTSLVHFGAVPGLDLVDLIIGLGIFAVLIVQHRC